MMLLAKDIMQSGRRDGKDLEIAKVKDAIKPS
jgi:hypothetical protein